MKFYIAARTSKVEEVRFMIEQLINLGHEITHDWTQEEDANLSRPYLPQLEKLAKLAQKDIDGAKTADIFIILGDKSGTGMYVEFGAALASGAKMYAVGEYNDVTVFHFHPSVTRVTTFAEVLNDLNL